MFLGGNLRRKSVVLLLSALLFSLLLFIIIYLYLRYSGYQEGLSVPIPGYVQGTALSDDELKKLVPSGYHLVKETLANGLTFNFMVADVVDAPPSGHRYVIPGDKTSGTVALTAATSYSDAAKSSAEKEPVIVEDPITKYDNSNYDVEYHNSADTVKETNDNYNIQFGSTWVRDKDGTMKLIPNPGMNSSITYYEPGSYRFSASSYVPNYEDSVYLSRSTYLPTYGKVSNTASMLGGFCEQDKGNLQKLEQTCNSVDLDKCASTSCCVLLGGSKCVAGNDKGAYFKSNYGDVKVRNKDVYYHQGKCYGNCA